jgi:transposase
MEYVGIDLHKKESQICLLTETGEVIERRIRTESQRFAEVLGGRPRARILVEASTESEWVARCLEALGHEVVVADPNFAPIYAHGRAPTPGGGRSSAERRWSSRARRTVGAHASGTACRHAHLRRPTRLALTGGTGVSIFESRIPRLSRTLTDPGGHAADGPLVHRIDVAPAPSLAVTRWCVVL